MKEYKIILGALIVLFFCSSVYAQRVNRWHQIDRSQLKTTLIDTSTIKKNEEQLSVWVLEIYNEPFEFENSGTLVKRVRTQYLFNTIKNEYSVIGELYYDVMGRILSQNYELRIGGKGRNFYKPIFSDSTVADLYAKIARFLNIAVLQTSIESDTENNLTKRTSTGYDSDVKESDQPVDQETGFAEIVEADDVIPEKSVIQGDEPLNSDSTSLLESPGITDNTQNGADTTNETFTYQQPIESTNQLESATKNFDEDSTSQNLGSEIVPYNNLLEQKITDTIFSDGYQYCVQISSWKNKNIAETEMNKLISQGHNAFIVEARPGHKKGTWYRVRIGYFTTLQEATAYQKSLK